MTCYSALSIICSGFGTLDMWMMMWLSSCLYAGTVKPHNLIIGSKHTVLSQCDDDLFGFKEHVLHNRITSSLYQCLVVKIVMQHISSVDLQET